MDSRDDERIRVHAGLVLAGVRERGFHELEEVGRAALARRAQGRERFADGLHPDEVGDEPDLLG